MDSSSKNQNTNRLSILKKSERLMGDKQVSLFSLSNDNGMIVEITNYGGIITKIKVPNKDGNIENVVFGYDDIDSYLENKAYLGAFIGRYANRIAFGKFKIDDKQYTLEKNNGPHALHGGTFGFDKKIWDASTFSFTDKVGLILEAISPDGEQGYPGNLEVTVKYTLSNKNELLIQYFAKTDRSTIVNFTNHSYFNLKGAGKGSISDHHLQINASHFTPVNDSLIPTGEIRSVADTPFDFIKKRSIGKQLKYLSDFKMKSVNGYDHNFVLDRVGDGLEIAAVVYEPSTGIQLEVSTTEPSMQLYTASNPKLKNKDKEDLVQDSIDAFCLETQQFPDAPNHAHFPSPILLPGEQFRSETLYRFSVR